MMMSLKSRLRAFAGESRGSVVTIFAVSLVPLVIVTGAAIDYSRAATQWNTLQQATDATALSAAHTYLSATSTAAALKTYSQNYIAGMMNGATVTNVTLSQTNTQVCVFTSFTVPTVFMKIININTMPTSTSACSQVGHTYEVALALDNSGSMAESAGGQSKIQAVQAAAKNLVSILIPSGSSAPQVAISLTPFTAAVNVGTNRTAPFLDVAGTSSLHWQNFQRPTGAGVWRPTSKFDLFDGIGVSWGGCVEELPPPYTATDQSSLSAADAKFVPYFSPDDPGSYNTNSGYECYPSSNNCGRQIPPYIFFNSYLNDNGASTSIGTCGSSNAYATADNNSSNIYPGSGASMVCKYRGATATSQTSSTGLNTGPNWQCTAQQLTPLTTDSSALNAAINKMAANGSTNLLAGFMWAWRTISPKVAAFPTTSTALIGPQNPKAYGYGPPPNTKIIILMTDGMNSWSSLPYNPFNSDYEAFGYFGNNRLAPYLVAGGIPGAATCSDTTTNANTSRCALDNATLDACSNAKNPSDPTTKIIIYTIGFSIPSDPIDAQGLNVLKTCATSPSYFFQASDSASINTAFQQIAASILSLRLSQ